ncbi:hypothetical protein BSCH_01574c [Candidatus Paraburkholderia schumanniana]|nr:hypothetical protein BSCH_01574c [Candidatus Paraburkholderia schumannianae]
MSAELERVSTGERRAPARHAVMRREYWQRRIDAVMHATADEPLRRDAAALSERLANAFADAPERVAGEAGEVAREASSRKRSEPA